MMKKCFLYKFFFVFYCCIVILQKVYADDAIGSGNNTYEQTNDPEMLLDDDDVLGAIDFPELSNDINISNDNDASNNDILDGDINMEGLNNNDLNNVEENQDDADSITMDDVMNAFDAIAPYDGVESEVFAGNAIDENNPQEIEIFDNALAELHKAVEGTNQFIDLISAKQEIPEDFDMSSGKHNNDICLNAMPNLGCNSQFFDHKGIMQIFDDIIQALSKSLNYVTAYGNNEREINLIVSQIYRVPSGQNGNFENIKRFHQSIDGLAVKNYEYFKSIQQHSVLVLEKLATVFQLYSLYDSARDKSENNNSYNHSGIINELINIESIILKSISIMAKIETHEKDLFDIWNNMIDILNRNIYGNNIMHLKNIDNISQQSYVLLYELHLIFTDALRRLEVMKNHYQNHSHFSAPVESINYQSVPANSCYAAQVIKPENIINKRNDFQNDTMYYPGRAAEQMLIKSTEQSYEEYLDMLKILYEAMMLEWNDLLNGSSRRTVHPIHNKVSGRNKKNTIKRWRNVKKNSVSKCDSCMQHGMSGCYKCT